MPRISPASILAALALFVALGGAAYAGSKIGSSAIKNSAITSKKLAKGAVTAKAIAKDAVTGKAVKESTLKTVPSATAAATAGGLTPEKFSARVTPPSALATVATVGTLDLQFGCSAGSPQLRVLPAAGASDQTTRSSLFFADAVKTQGQGTLPASGIDILDGTEAGDFSFNGTLDSLTEDGGVTTVQWAARSTSLFPSPNPDGNRCLFWGTSLSG
jgi:hypothetical protein